MPPPLRSARSRRLFGRGGRTAGRLSARELDDFERLRGLNWATERVANSRLTPCLLPKQLVQQKAFKAAQTYARVVLADPCQRRVYTDKIVESDYLRPPVVEHIEHGAYRRQMGYLIRIIATDDIEVVSVNVAITRATARSSSRAPPARCTACASIPPPPPRPPANRPRSRPRPQTGRDMKGV